MDQDTSAQDISVLFAKKRKRGRKSPIKMTATEEMPTVKSERIMVRIIDPTGRILTFQCDVSKQLVELKNQAIIELNKLNKPKDSDGIEPRYRLIRADFDACELNETLTLEKLKIVNDEMLLMLERRNVLQQNMAKVRENRGPTQMEIQEATRHIRSNNHEVPQLSINETFQQSNLQFDVRKIIIPIAIASAAIIGAGPLATELVRSIKQKLINKRNSQLDTLQSLIDMGFKQELAEYALKITDGVYAAALEWLMQSQNTPPEGAAIHKSQSAVSISGLEIDDTALTNTESLLKIVRIYGQREIPPNPEALAVLIEMGFSEHAALIALRKTYNNIPAACEYCLGLGTENLLELREGLSQNSPVVKTILRMPQIQVGLSNPQMFLAFLSILASESNISAWGAENETTDVMRTIFNSYNQEKHIISLNQLHKHSF